MFFLSSSGDDEHYYDNPDKAFNESVAPPTTTATRRPTITRIYSGNDGQSHLETIPLAMEPFQDIEGSYGWATPLLQGRGVVFRTSPPQYALSWHTAPRRQYVIQLQGRVEIQVGCGGGGDKGRNKQVMTTMIMGPGDVLLAEDLTGQGHCTRVVGNETRFYAVIPLDDNSSDT